jgi:transposase
MLKYAHNDYVPGKGSVPRIIQELGYLDELMKEYPDPYAHFQEEARKINESAKMDNQLEIIEYDKKEKLAEYATDRNIGYAALSQIYHELELDVYFSNRSRKYKVQYSINAIMRLLVYMRVLKPGSKKKAHESRGWFFEKTDFSLDDVYRSLTYINIMADDCQVWMNNHIRSNNGRDMTYIYYDVTNYYFEIDEEDEIRKKGVSKEFRPDPIVQMGLFMDGDGIPIAYRLFPGNNNDCTTFVPFMSELRRDYEIGRTVVIADKGMNTSNNVYYLASRNNWYIFSQSVRGGSKELKEYVLKKNGYMKNGNDSKIKSRQFTRHVKIEQPDGAPPIEADISERQVAFYSGSYARKAKKDRQKAIKKAKDIIKNPSGYNKYNVFGAAKYVKHLEYDSETGEIIEAKSIIQFNDEKLEEDEKYDGYYIITTNAYNKDDSWVLDKYRGLWEIEDTFKVTKKDLEARPVRVSRQDHINAHFLICFIALTIVRLLQKRLNGKYSSSKLVESLSRACCAHLAGNKYIAYFHNPFLGDLGNELGINFDKKHWELNDIKKMLGNTKK